MAGRIKNKINKLKNHSRRNNKFIIIKYSAKRQCNQVKVSRKLGPVERYEIFQEDSLWFLHRKCDSVCQTKSQSTFQNGCKKQTNKQTNKQQTIEQNSKNEINSPARKK